MHSTLAPHFRKVVWLPIVFLYLSLVSHGTFSLFPPTLNGNSYSSMWNHLKHGSAEIDPSSTYEIYIRDGKAYSYYGIFPALLRGIAQAFGVDIEKTDLATVSCLIGALLIAFGLSRSAILIGGWSKVLGQYPLVVLVVFSSPVLCLLGWVAQYSEAILWGVAWAIVSQYGVFRLLLGKPVATNFTLVCAGAGLSLLSRVSIGASLVLGAVALGVCLLFFSVETPNRLRKLIPGSALLALLVSVFLWNNYARWGNPFETMPIERLSPVSPVNHPGMENAAVAKFVPSRIPDAIQYYLSVHRHHFSRSWPFIKLGEPTLQSPLKFIYVEKTLPLPLANPGFLIFGALGVFLIFRSPSSRRRKILTFYLVALFVTPTILFGFHSLAMRYELDFFPLLSFLSIICFAEIGRGWETYSRKRRQLIAVGLWGIVAVSVLAIPLVQRALEVGTADGLISRSYWIRSR